MTSEATHTRTVRFVVPAGVDDPRRVSGGNVYDREVREGLRRRGWSVEVAEVADAAAALDVTRGDGLVLVDGLVAGWAPAAIEDASRRARVAILAHMITAAFPDASVAQAEAERRALGAAHLVIATSRWTADEAVRRGLVADRRIAVAAPGVRRVAPATGPSGPRDLLCVGVVAPHKGQDLLLTALARLADDGIADDWTCRLVGSREHDPVFTARIVGDAARFGGRVELTGVLDGADLERAYRHAAVVVAPSRVESAGMAIAEARVRGIPVIGAAVGGIPETLAGGGALLVRPDDPTALAAAIGSWMTDPALRARLRGEAFRARDAVPRWDDTVAAIDEALAAA